MIYISHLIYKIYSSFSESLFQSQILLLL